MHEYTNALISKWTSNIMNRWMNERWARLIQHCKSDHLWSAETSSPPRRATVIQHPNTRTTATRHCSIEMICSGWMQKMPILADMELVIHKLCISIIDLYASLSVDHDEPGWDNLWSVNVSCTDGWWVSKLWICHRWTAGLSFDNTSDRRLL